MLTFIDDSKIDLLKTFIFEAVISFLPRNSGHGFDFFVSEVLQYITT